jgi:hypothetical protein
MVAGVPTILQRDDALQVFSKRPADLAHSLADLYGIAPRDIVEKYNDVKWDKFAIDRWVMATGGIRRPYDESQPFDEKNKLGWASFSDKSVIFLPPNGPRPPLIKGKPGLSKSGWLAVGGIVAAGLYAAFGSH